MAKWTDSELTQLQNMMAQRIPHAAIATTLGRSIKSIRTKMDHLKRPHEYRAMARKRYAAARPQRSVEDREPRPTDEMMFARYLRLSAPYRDLTGLLLGDPRVGYAALDNHAVPV